MKNVFQEAMALEDVPYNYRAYDTKTMRLALKEWQRFRSIRNF